MRLAAKWSGVLWQAYLRTHIHTHTHTHTPVHTHTHTCSHTHTCTHHTHTHTHIYIHTLSLSQCFFFVCLSLSPLSLSPLSLSLSLTHTHTQRHTHAILTPVMIDAGIRPCTTFPRSQKGDSTLPYCWWRATMTTELSPCTHSSSLRNCNTHWAKMKSRWEEKTDQLTAFDFDEGRDWLAASALLRLRSYLGQGHSVLEFEQNFFFFNHSDTLSTEARFLVNVT